MRLLLHLSVFVLLLNLSPLHASGQDAAAAGSAKPPGFDQLDALAVANRFRDPAAARQFARTAASVAAANGLLSQQVRAHYLLAITMAPEDQDSVFLHLNEALQLAAKGRYEHESPGLYYILALMYKNSGQVRTAVTCLDTALRLASRLNQPGNSARIYTLLGNIRIEDADTAGAIQMYNRAYAIGERTRDPYVSGLALANLATLRPSREAYLAGLLQALALLRRTKGNEEEVAQTLINAGLVETDPVDALRYYGEALTLGRKSRMPESQLGALNNMVYSLLDLGMADSADRSLLRYAIPLAVQYGSHDWLATLYDTRADVLIARKEFSEATAMLRKAMEEKRLFDAQRSATQVRLLAAMMDARNREEALQASLQALENHRKSVRIQYLVGLSVLLAALLTILALWVRSQRRKIRLKNRELLLIRRMNEFEEHQSAVIGRELHDVISGLMQQMAGISNDGGEAEPATKLIAGRLTRLRSLSHRMYRLDFSSRNPLELLAGMAEDVVHLTGMNLTLELPESLPALSESLSRNLYRIVQELIANAGKHAPGARVQITLSCLNGRLLILYNDDGPGLKTRNRGNDGMGLSGIRDRAELFGGRAQVESPSGGGLAWIISIPLPFHPA